MDDETNGLEPLASLTPERHAARVRGMFHVIPIEQPFGVQDQRVYLARLANGTIKIGTTCAPKNRMRELRYQVGMPVTLIGTLPGAYERERYLHSVYADERIGGEIFASSPRLEAFATSLTSPSTPQVAA